METIHIYHTNDLHSHLENWPRIESFLGKQKQIHRNEKEEVFLFDIGDFIDRFHPISEATKGKANIGLLNDSGFHAATIGNNEGVNLPHDDLDSLYDSANFDVLVANLYTKQNQHPRWVKPYSIFNTSQNTRIGVIGLTYPFTHLYDLLGWKCTEPKKELRKWVKVVREQADIVIVLSHLGLNMDVEIAEEFPEVDVILGAHTHHVLEEGKVIGDTLLGAAGKYGYLVGQVTLLLDEDKNIMSKKAKLYETKKLPVANNEEERVKEFFLKGKDLLRKRVTVLNEPLVHNAFQETNLSRLLCQALREWCKTDCAMINAGLLLDTLEGEVTEYDLLSICPHPINPCVVEVTGKELKSILVETQREDLAHKIIKGLGFRGTVLGTFVFDQIQFTNGKIFVQGRPIEQNKQYTLALPDMFTFGHFFKDVLPSKKKTYFLPEFLRDLLEWKLKRLE